MQEITVNQLEFSCIQVHGVAKLSFFEHCNEMLKSTGPPTDSRDPSKKLVRHTRNRRRKQLPVCFHHGGKRLSELGLTKTVIIRREKFRKHVRGSQASHDQVG